MTETITDRARQILQIPQLVNLPEPHQQDLVRGVVGELPLLWRAGSKIWPSTYAPNLWRKQHLELTGGALRLA